MSKIKPMCQIPVGYLCVSVDEYRMLVEDLQRFCTENRDLRGDLHSRINVIANLQKALDEAQAELSQVKNAEDIWYKKFRETEEKLKAFEGKSDASPENS